MSRVTREDKKKEHYNAFHHRGKIYKFPPVVARIFGRGIGSVKEFSILADAEKEFVQMLFRHTSAEYEWIRLDTAEWKNTFAEGNRRDATYIPHWFLLSWKTGRRRYL